MTADVPTLLVMIIVSSVVMAGGLLILGWGSRKDGLHYWAASLLLNAIGYVCFLLRGQLSDLVAIVLANTLISLSFSGLWVAVLRFYGQRFPWCWLLLPPVVIAVLMWTLIDNFASRVAASAVVLVLQTFLMQRELLRHHRKSDRGQGMQFLLAGIALEGITLALRGAGALASMMQENNILQNNLVQTLTFMVAFVAILITSMGFVFMAKDRADAINLRLATQDALTGVANRRSIMATLEQTLAQAQNNHLRNPPPLAILMLDIDHFKKVNDGYGHLGGDQVLCHVAQVIQQHLGKQGVLGRYGGEEFLLLLPKTQPAQALALAQALCQVVQANPCPWEQGDILSTISIGLWCGHPPPQKSLEQLVDAADRALYRAKENGRNRVEVASAAAL